MLPCCQSRPAAAKKHSTENYLHEQCVHEEHSLCHAPLPLHSAKQHRVITAIAVFFANFKKTAIAVSTLCSCKEDLCKTLVAKGIVEWDSVHP